MSIKLLTDHHLEFLSLKRCCTGSSESTLVKIPHRWKSYGPRREKTCLWGFANNEDADQPAHPRSLISTFVIRFLESIISKLATSEILIFWLVYTAGQAGLNLALPETPKTGFVATPPICQRTFLQTKFGQYLEYLHFLLSFSQFFCCKFNPSKDGKFRHLNM